MPGILYPSFLVTGFFLGLLYVLETGPDENRTLREAGEFQGLRGWLSSLWPVVMNGLVLLLLAGLLLALKSFFANVPLAIMERALGFSLIYIGAMFWVRELNRARRPGDFKEKGGGMWAGIFRGAVGWSGIFILIPVVLFERKEWVLGYIGLFVLGTILGKGLMAGATHRIGWLGNLKVHKTKFRCLAATLTLLIGLRLLLVA